MKQYKATPSTKQPIKASTDKKPEGARIAENAADNIEILFEMNANDEVPLSTYLTRDEASVLQNAIEILRDFEKAYTIDERGW